MSGKEQKVPNEQTLEDAGNVPEQQTTETVEVPETEKVEDPRITELEAQLAEKHQKLLSAQAENENILRRSKMSIEEAHKFSLAKFSKELLPVVDSLEKALELVKSADDKSKVASASMAEGIELTLKSFLNVFHKFGIKVIDEVHVPFDPASHEAMVAVESTDCKPKHVIDVMQKGYTLNGRLLRAAQVAVSKEKV